MLRPSLTALFCFIVFLLGTSSSVSLQDAGELIAAVFTQGVPHPPGYPLFVLLGQIFIKIPFSTIVFRMNLMSAFFTSLGAFFLYLAIRELFKKIFQKPANENLIMATVLLAIMTPTSFAQSVITEVYGLNSFLCCLLIYLIIKDFFFLSCFVLGLALCNHHTSWCFGLLILFAQPIRKLKTWFMGLLFFLLGLIPYFYLPWAAAQKPLLNWGNPSDWQSFWQHLTRFQYAPQLYRQSLMAIEQVREQIIWLVETYPFPFLLLASAGIFFLFEKSKKTFIWMFAGLILTGPITALVTNFRYPFYDPLGYEEARYLVSVFFIPHYFFWALFFIIGVNSLLEQTKKIKLQWVSAACLLLALAYTYQTYSKENKRDERAAENIFYNWQKLIGSQPALIISNWDPFYFPPLYYQVVEKKEPQWVLVDIELMKLPWYIESLRQNYPEFVARFQTEADEFLKQMKPFFAKTAYDEKLAFQSYIKMLNAMIDHNFTQMPVYLALHRSQRKLPIGVAENYKIQAFWVLGKLSLQEKVEPSLSVNELDFSGFAGPTVERDYVLRSVSFYHIQLILETVLLLKDKNLSMAKAGLEVARNLSNKITGPKQSQLHRQIEEIAQLVTK